MKQFARYWLNVAIGLDQFANTWAGGCPDETISSRLGRIKEEHGGLIPWTRPLAKVIDWGLDKIDRNHSINAIEHDEIGQSKKDSVTDKPKLDTYK